MGSSEDDIEYHSTEWISEPNRSAIFGDYLSGDIKGEEYTIAAYLRKYREDVGLWEYTLFDWYDTKVYKPKFKAIDQFGVSGSVYLYSLDYSYPNITPTGEAYAYNNSNEPRYVFHRFRHTVTGPNNFIIDREDITNGEEKHIPLPDSGYSASVPSKLSISISGGEPVEDYRSQVYMRLEVAGEDENKVEMVMHFTTGRLKKISNHGISRPEFSPDGKHIIFTTITVLGGEGSNVWIMKANGSDARRLLPPPPL